MSKTFLSNINTFYKSLMSKYNFQKTKSIHLPKVPYLFYLINEEARKMVKLVQKEIIPVLIVVHREDSTNNRAYLNTKLVNILHATNL